MKGAIDSGNGDLTNEIARFGVGDVGQLGGAGS
jgi:hypothetical protein